MVVVFLLHHVVPPLPFFVARIVVVIVSLATTNDDDNSVLRDAIVSLVFLDTFQRSLSRKKCRFETHARLYIYVCVINKKRERIDTNERERAPSFFATTTHTRGGGGLSKSALAFHDTHNERL